MAEEKVEYFGIPGVCFNIDGDWWHEPGSQPDSDGRKCCGVVGVDNAEVVPTPLRRSPALDVAAERARQDARWGEQNHLDGTGPGTRPLRAVVDADVQPTARWLAARSTSLTDTRFRAGDGTWRDILLEEVFEAFAEDDPESLRAELVQVAAVAQAWAEAIDRRGGAS